MASKLPTILVRIQTADRLLWEGSALAVSSKNIKGPFDILPKHAHFVTMIKDESIIIHTVEADEKVFTFPRAVLYVQNDKVTVFAGV